MQVTVVKPSGPVVAPQFEGITARSNGTAIAAGDCIVGSAELTVRWLNPDDRTATYAWTVTRDAQPATSLPATTPDTEGGSVRTFKVPNLYASSTYVFTCRVTLSDGTVVDRSLTLKSLALPK